MAAPYQSFGKRAKFYLAVYTVNSAFELV